MLITIDGFLDDDEVSFFRSCLEGADWEQGSKSAGTLARHQKHNLQLAEDDALAVDLRNRLLRKLGNHPLFVSAALPRKIYPPRFNKYEGGGTYGSHVDSALMRVPGTDVTVRTDMSATLFLSDPGDYDGGELEIEGPAGLQSVKLPAGDMVLYLSTTVHRVLPVTRGARLASFLWVESYVQDDGERALMFELDQAIQGLGARVPADDPDLVRLTGVYHNLMRRWAVT